MAKVPTSGLLKEKHVVPRLPKTCVCGSIKNLVVKAPPPGFTRFRRTKAPKIVMCLFSFNLRPAAKPLSMPPLLEAAPAPPQ